MCYGLIYYSLSGSFYLLLINCDYKIYLGLPKFSKKFGMKILLSENFDIHAIFNEFTTPPFKHKRAQFGHSNHHKIINKQSDD